MSARCRIVPRFYTLCGLSQHFGDKSVTEDAGHPHIAPIIFLRLRDEFFNVTVGFCSLAGVLV